MVFISFTETLPKHFAFFNSLKLFITIYTNLYLLAYRAISHYYNSIEHCYLSSALGTSSTKPPKASAASHQTCSTFLSIKRGLNALSC